MTFRNESTRWVDDNTAAVSEISVIDTLSSGALSAKTKSLICYKLISGEAIVQFTHLNLLGSQVRFFECHLSGFLWHLIPNQIHRRFLKTRCHIGHQTESFYLHSLCLQPRISLQKLFRAQYCRRRPITCRTTLEFSQWIVNLGRLLNLFQRVLISKLAIRIINRMLVILVCYFSEMRNFGPMAFHVLSACIAEKPRRHRRFRFALQFDVLDDEFV